MLIQKMNLVEVFDCASSAIYPTQVSVHKLVETHLEHVLAVADNYTINIFGQFGYFSVAMVKDVTLVSDEVWIYGEHVYEGVFSVLHQISCHNLKWRNRSSGSLRMYLTLFEKHCGRLLEVS